MEPHFFKNQADLRRWFLKNHKKETELLVGYHKVGSGKPSVSWPESVDEALCFGWIDGVRKSIDHESYTIRFTRRKPSSNWSSINIAKVENLIGKELMQPEGLEAFDKRQEKKSRIYSYESEQKTLDDDYIKQFKADKAAWAFFRAGSFIQKGSYSPGDGGKTGKDQNKQA